MIIAKPKVREYIYIFNRCSKYEKIENVDKIEKIEKVRTLKKSVIDEN